MCRTLLIFLIILPNFILAQGTCGSPDGAVTEIDSPPADYQELEDNGYCMDGTGSTKWHDMCFTFTPDVSAVALNAGYSSSCVITQFDLALTTLYDNTCTAYGTGLTFTGLTPGEQYTWCLRMKASGGPGCNGFDRMCPYWMDNTQALPVTLESFDCEGSTVKWTTATERNNSGFYLVNDNGKILGWIEGVGQSSINVDYYYEVGSCENFVCLIQVDYDGKTTKYPYDNCDCDDVKLQKGAYLYNILGQRTKKL